MNTQRKQTIKSIISKLYELETAIDEVLIDEQESFDDLPEEFQHSIKGDDIERAINLLERAYYGISDVIELLMRITD